MKNIESQNKQIRKHLESGKPLTALEALYKFGCFRLSGRIYDLRKSGLHIISRTREVTSKSVYSGKKHFSEYYIKK
jgi:hypothetical protein